MIQDPEQLIDEVVKSVKTNADLSDWKKNRKLTPFVNLISNLNSVPKTRVPQFDFLRVREQILAKITTPQIEAIKHSWLPKFFGIGAGVIGSFLIVTSLTIATAVAALQSVPGQTIYPFKKVVENVQLKFASDDKKLALQLQFAQNRAEEIRAVLEKQEEGKLTTEQTQEIVSATVEDLKTATNAAASATVKQPKVAVVNKLTDLSNRLKAAAISTSGEVKIEIDKAVESTKISQEEAIKNIENAGIKVEDKPIIDDAITASGKLTVVSETSVSIGTARFLITKDTKYQGVKAEDLKIGQIVDISGQIKDNKTYAIKITLVTPVAPVPGTIESLESTEESQ